MALPAKAKMARQDANAAFAATSFLYGFKDEIAIRVTRTEMGARVDVRSRSRIGRIDRGANARRIRAFLDDLASRPFAKSREES